MKLAHWVLATAHVLAGASWFGAMFYSLTVLHPRARSFFTGARQFEEFIAHIAAGARWKVLGGAVFIAITGLGLVLLPGEHMSPGQRGCLVAKAILFVVAVSLFSYTSWVLWPARVLASLEEVPKFQRRFRIIGRTLLALVGASIVLGVLSPRL